VTSLGLPGPSIDLNREGRLKFNTEYQRSKVWPYSKKYLLIDSMLRQYDISLIFLRQMDNGSYECLDGQQRLRSIFEFIDEGFPIVPSVTKEAEKYTKYSELSDGMKSRIREFIIHSVVVNNTDDETTSDIFLRLQEGMPLNSPEKLNAISGFMRKRVIEISRHPFFTGIGLADTRFGHRYMAAQILALALAKTYVGLKFPVLRALYIGYKDQDVPPAAIERVKGALTLLNSSLGTHKPAVKFRADIVSVYTLADAIRNEYSTTGVEPTVGKFIVDFLARVGDPWASIGTPDFQPYGRYAILRSSSADSAPNVKERHEIILSKFLQFNPTILPKDPVRAFSYAERLALYQRAGGKCEICGKETPFDKGQADHKKRHTDGGLTTIDNGRWLCAKDNAAISLKPT
jgi:hypothetical protein